MYNISINSQGNNMINKNFELKLAVECLNLSGNNGYDKAMCNYKDMTIKLKNAGSIVIEEIKSIYPQFNVVTY